jgi:hypothetical protein
VLTARWSWSSFLNVPALRALAVHGGGDYRMLAREISSRSLPGAVMVYPGGDRWATRDGMNYYLPTGQRPPEPLLAESPAERGEFAAAQKAGRDRSR